MANDDKRSSRGVEDDRDWAVVGELESHPGAEAAPRHVARGQGRSHALRFAEEGADIIAVDLCEQIDSVAYSMATPEDLDETVNLVEKTGRRIVAEQADVRDFQRLKSVVDKGVAELGRLDFVLANAGIAPVSSKSSQDISAYLDAVQAPC